jgi:hypothetical protein
VRRYRPNARSRALADALGLLGYPGFQTLLTELEKDEAAAQDPAVVLIAALSAGDLDPRVVEALPWLVLRYEHLDWHWTLREARRRKVQNRLGYVVSLALRLAASGASSETLTHLSNIEEEIFDMRLDAEDTFCQKVPESGRDWLREARPPEARQWNILSDLRPQDLPYGAP